MPVLRLAAWPDISGTRQRCNPNREMLTQALPGFRLQVSLPRGLRACRAGRCFAAHRLTRDAGKPSWKCMAWVMLFCKAR